MPWRRRKHAAAAAAIADIADMLIPDCDALPSITTNCRRLTS